MNYKPYSIEWTRKRNLSESIQQYLDDDVDIDIILNDIVDIFEDNITYHRTRAEKFQEILDGIKSLPY